MKLLMIFSYFTDGFAYAGEALTGRYIGERDAVMLRQTVKWTFIWSMSIALVFILLYGFGGKWMLHLMTSDIQVVGAALDYLPWLMVMPIVGCAAFTWDGIYIGAVASRKMRNSMIWATVGFFLSYFIARMIWQDDSLAVHVLMAAYFVHLLIRTIYLTFNAKNVWMFDNFD